MPDETLDPTVGELLELSRAAHEEYRANRPRMASVAGGTVAAVRGDELKAAAALARAADLRAKAHAADPGHLEDAWVIDAAITGGEHVLATWYSEHLARTDDPVAVAAQRIVDGKRSPAQDAAPVELEVKR